MDQSDTSKSLIKPWHATYALVILFIVYVFKYADRFILIVVQNDIQKELGLSDQQLGLLSGMAFAVFYSLIGVPVARLADRKSRTWIITIGVAAWSGLTALCGMVQNFAQFAITRVGVGVGEAFATPCSHSLLADYYPPEKRGKIIGIYSVGANVGMLLGMMAGGIIASKFGWRNAFFILGIPGIIVAILVKTTIKEPPRGLSDHVEHKVNDMTFFQTLKYLFTIKSFRHLSAAGSIAACTGFGLMHFLPVFLERCHHMTKQQYGPVLGVSIGIIGGVSVLLGGLISDKFGKKNRKWYMYTAVIGMCGMFPLILFFMLTGSYTMVIVGINLAFLVGNMYTAPTFATIQGLAKPNMRAFASALFLMLTNLIGSGIGPWLVGLTSDLLKPSYGDDSIRYALIIISLGCIWSIFHYLMAARTLPDDLDRALA